MATKRPWALLAVHGHNWPFMGITGCPQELLGVHGPYWALLGITEVILSHPGVILESSWVIMGQPESSWNCFGSPLSLSHFGDNLVHPGVILSHPKSF